MRQPVSGQDALDTREAGGREREGLEVGETVDLATSTRRTLKCRRVVSADQHSRSAGAVSRLTRAVNGVG